MNTVERFESKIMMEPNSGCWLWTDRPSTNGYGIFSVGGKKITAHRFSYELHVGKIPEGLDLDHLCRTRCCVRPSHLEPVTRSENLKRGIGVAATAARLRIWQMGKTHCPKGHPYSGSNLHIDKKGYRKCRECWTILNKKRHLSTPPLHLNRQTEAIVAGPKPGDQT